MPSNDVCIDATFRYGKMRHNINFKQSNAGLNSEFSFS